MAMLKGVRNVFNISPRFAAVYFKNVVRGLSSEPPLTSEQYPDLKRGPYSEVTNDDLAKFSSILDPHRVVQDPEEIAPRNMDWMKSLRGTSNVLLKPKTTQEISEILAYCNSRKIAVVPQSGNTGLVGGSMPVFDEVILSLGLMDNIISIDDISGILVCQAGCILEKLDQFLSERGFMMPLDLGAKGSCMIGGNIATNAGGLRLLRYGSLHGTVLGLEAVLPNGQIIDTLSTCRKDNTGYHLKHMFIGSEGTLGVITAASIMVPYLPRSINVALLGCQSFEDLQRIFKAAKSMLGEVLSAFEMMDYDSVKASEFIGLQNPIGENNFYALIETSGSDAAHDEEKLTALMEWLMNEDLVQDGTIATDKQKMTNIWAVRENIAAGLLEIGYVYKYDVSIPVPRLYEIVEDLRNKIGDKVITIVGYGHIGDGNLHLNIVTEEHDPKVHQLLEPYIFEWVRDCEGSISAEHGIGFKKTKYLHYSKSMECINIMKDLKKMFDPNGILNPYKVLPNK
ncbi:D-2-hydroxyglutarate dehydrogenase, mitochondrial [Paramuricea clavata]|uniref:D-2-hydroxyglutarate dehydrogenase, mitochondrial n=1 Tax=Paramuricea clavata TaxID=317549 RepID=A0A6S7GIG9_PARCT|nr:D-2-hydroxyglutarate dehydrogenase, mitochondrial [Paramuricea clavata]